MEKHGRIHLQDVAACAGLALLFSLSDVINAHIFPLFHDLIPMAKDLGTATGIAALLIIAKGPVRIRLPIYISAAPPDGPLSSLLARPSFPWAAAPSSLCTPASRW